MMKLGMKGCMILLGSGARAGRVETAGVEADAFHAAQEATGTREGLVARTRRYAEAVERNQSRIRSLGRPSAGTRAFRELAFARAELARNMRMLDFCALRLSSSRTRH
jgi:hypothetical protein